jgi:oxygen-dependent protoporphyrinogen oxidase
MKKIQIIGGGFCGLALSYFFSKRGFTVRLVEKQETLGGMISTRKHSQGLVETAANAVLSNAVVERVATDLGLTLVPTLPAAKRRFIFRDRPKRWPLSVAASLKFSKVILQFLRRREALRPQPRETIRQWGTRILGQEITEYLLIPALTGIYAGDADRLSASLILGRFFTRQRLPKGKLKGSVAPSGGMGEWITAFAQHLQQNGGSIEREPDFSWPTVFAVPAHELAGYAAQVPELARLTAQIEYLPLVTATLFFPDRAPKLSGFGCLFPRKEGIRALGMLCNHAIFPQRCFQGFSETWISGGAVDPGILNLNDHELVESLMMDRFKLFPSSLDPEHWEICRWPKAIPHYTVELEEIVETLTARNFRENQCALFGTYLGDLGLARILPRAERFVEEF